MSTEKFLLVSVIVNDEQYCGQSPGNGITKQDTGDSGRQGNDEKNPEYTQDTYPAAGHQHRRQYVSHTSQCARQNLNKDKQHIGWGDNMDDLHADLDNVRICGKQTEQELSQEKQQCADQDGSNKVKQQAHFDTFFHSIVLACPVILPDKGHDGYTECTGDHPVDGIYFSESSVGCHGICSQTVKGGLDDHVGDVVHNRLDACRKTDGNDGDQQEFVKAYLFWYQPVHIGGAHQDNDHQHGTYCLGNDSGYGSSRNSHVKENNQHDIQKNINKTAYNEKV